VFAIAGRMQFDESVRDDLIAVLDELNTKSPGEAGCVTYAFTADLSDPNTFRFFECWEDEPTFDAHCATPHYVDFTTRFLPKLTSVEATRFEISDTTKLA
jgi:quinol monooxygenase YgiN